MSKHVAMSATVTMGTPYQVAKPRAVSTTSAAMPAKVTLGGNRTVTPRIPA
jgi:hypothetical protein